MNYVSLACPIKFICSLVFMAVVYFQLWDDAGEINKLIFVNFILKNNFFFCNIPY